MPCPHIYSGDQGVPLWGALISSQYMLQCGCQLMAMQRDHTVIMIACCDDHSRVLFAAVCGRLDIVYGAVRVDVGKVLCLIWVSIVTGPGMACITTQQMKYSLAFCQGMKQPVVS